MTSLVFFVVGIVCLVIGVVAMPTKPKAQTPQDGDMRIVKSGEEFHIERYHSIPSWEFWSPRGHYSSQQEVEEASMRLNTADEIIPAPKPKQ